MCNKGMEQKSRVLVAPSVLSADFANLAKSCEEVLFAGADMLHIDVMDGVFVPNISIGIPVVKSLRKALPDAFFDVHLMITRPLQYVDDFARAGASLISFHLEAEADARETINAVHKAGCSAGIVLKPGTQVQEVFPYLHDVELVLVMSVEPGFGGQAFISSALEKIKEIRQYAAENELHSLQIQVDGGINEKTAGDAVQSGADILVAGSAIFEAENKAQMINLIRGV